MEKHIKERLVGAIVLVAIVVVVVPELLTGPRVREPGAPPSEVVAPVRTVTIDLATRAQRDATAAERVADAPSATPPGARRSSPADAARGDVDRTGLPPTDASASAPDATSADAPSSQAAPAVAAKQDAPAPTSAASAPSGVSPPASAEKSATAQASPAAAPSGAGAPTPSASRAEPTPKSPPRATAAVTNTAAATKPAATRSDAPASAPPRPSAPSSSAAEGWVVQLGSFASRPNAERLAADLRSRGYAGFVSEFRGSGRVLYRVRVGPEQDRARAEAIAQRLAREGKKGSVTPHP